MGTLALLRRGAAVAAAILAAGCRFAQLGAELEAIEHYGVLSGTAELSDWSGAPILVAVATRSDDWNAPLQVVAHVYLAEPGYWEFTLPPGRYQLGAVEDLDRGQDLDVGERYALLPEPFALRAGAWIPEIRIELTIPRSAGERELALADRRSLVAGERSELSHPRFDRGEAELGLWRPLHAMERFAAGLFLLEDWDPARVPVVFVHGMGGTARDFAPLLARLDRARFQPWVYQYPSALPLAMLAEGLEATLVELHGRLGFERACVVAHSMGGLVARHALGALARRGEVPIRGFASIASPLAGVRSARTGVEMAPAVVPSWRDVNPGSPFLRELYREPLPATLPYTLVFAFQPGASSDGVVEIASQLRDEAQAEAVRVRGVAAGHVDVLGDERAAEAVGELLERCAGEAGG